MTEIKRGPTYYMVEAVNAYIRENEELRAEIWRLTLALKQIADDPIAYSDGSECDNGSLCVSIAKAALDP